MRYYLSSNISPNFNKIKNLLVNKKTEKVFLSFDGLYKINDKDKLLKYKLKTSHIKRTEPILLDKFPDIILYESDVQWVISVDEIMQIPYEHSTIEIIKTIYKLHPKSITNFIVERSNLVNNVYFSSKETIDNFSFKEDIEHFLKLLNCNF